MLLFVGAPAAVSSSMPIAITVEEPTQRKEKNLSHKCAKALANKRRFLSQVKRQKYSSELVGEYFTGFYSGQYGCSKNFKFAHEILDSHVGYPIRKYVSPNYLDLLLSNHREELAKQRVKDLEGALFIRTYVGADEVPEYWKIEEIEELLLSNDNWKLAANILFSDKDSVRNQLRDDLLIKNLIDPKSSIYDLEKAIQLVSHSSRHSYRMRVAEQLAKRNSDVTDVRTAFELMQWYSPFVHRDIPQKDVNAAEPVLTDILRLMAESDDAELRAKSKAIRQTDNPHAETGQQSVGVEKNLKKPFVTITWPDRFGDFRTIRSPDSYPSRALRERAGGRVQAAALFNPNGSYDGMIIISSSGRADLDRATMRNLERYNRLKSKTLSGFEGKYVKIPMPDVEWHLLDEKTVGESGVFISDNTTKVVARVFTPTIVY